MAASFFFLGVEPRQVVLSYLVPSICQPSPQDTEKTCLAKVLFHQDAWWACLAKRGLVVTAAARPIGPYTGDDGGIAKQTGEWWGEALWRLFKDGEWFLPELAAHSLGGTKNVFITEHAHVQALVQYIEKLASVPYKLHKCPCTTLWRAGGRPQLDVPASRFICTFSFDVSEIVGAEPPEVTRDSEGVITESSVSPVFSTSIEVPELPAFALRLQLTGVTEGDSEDEVAPQAPTSAAVHRNWELSVQMYLRNDRNTPPITQTQLAVEVFILHNCAKRPLQFRFRDYCDDELSPLGGIELNTVCSSPVDMTLDSAQAAEAMAALHCAVVVSAYGDMGQGSPLLKNKRSQIALRILRQHNLEHIKHRTR